MIVITLLSGLSEFMPRMHVSTLISRNPLVRSLIGILFVADVGYTNLKETVTIGKKSLVKKYKIAAILAQN